MHANFVDAPVTDLARTPAPAEVGEPARTAALLSALAQRFGESFELTPARLRSATAGRAPSADTCITCDAPQDTCASCDASDLTCNKQHDIVCIRCDEGDLTCPRDGACNLIGDIPCGRGDT